jgi:DNA polymerase-3 subunit gamma/tau
LPNVLEGFSSLHRDGAEAGEIISDLAGAVHAIARVKAVGEEPASEGMTTEEKQRCADLAARLSMPYLSRAWQMLLKGIEEVGRAPNPHTAAEMVLIRLAYTADLPTPDELIRTLGGGAISARRPALAPAAGESRTESRPTVNVTTTTPQAQGEDTGSDDAFDFDDGDDNGDLDDGIVDADDEQMQSVAPPPSALANPRTFAEVVALVGTKRDAKLKIHLEDHVSLVKFDAVAGSIDIFLLPGAPPELANDLREKLNGWTTRRWVVVLSKEAGQPAIGEVRRAREAAELEQLKALPAVRAVLQAFPDAKMEVRRIAGSETDTEDDKESEAS